MNTHSRLFAAALAAVAFAGALPSQAHDYTVGTLAIDHPWARATVGTARPGGAYLTITNKGSTPDRLVAAESPNTARIELHRSMMEDGMMRMVPVGTIDIPAGGSVKFAPGGYHLMLMGLKAPMVAGKPVPLVLVFEKAGRVTVAITVEPLGGGKAGAGMNMNGKGH